MRLLAPLFPLLAGMSWPVMGWRRQQGRLPLQRSDSGTGLAPGRLRGAFKEVVQMRHTEHDGGQGLGSAIVRRLSLLLEHSPFLRPGPGAGTTVAIAAPEAPRGPPPPARPAAPSARALESGRQVTILVVDDETIILMGLQAMLESWGYHVIPANSAQQALERLRAAALSPDLVLADYRLRAGQIGPDMVRAVQALCAWPVPAVILTGDTDPARIAEVEGAGFGILHKPVTARDLRRAVEARLPSRPGPDGAGTGRA